MDEPLWWPKGVSQTPYDSAAQGDVRTQFGTLKLWDFNPTLNDTWWQNPPSEGKVWGNWPDVKILEVIQIDRYGILLNLNGSHIARISPFAVGDDVSRMARHEPWNHVLSEQSILMPTAIWIVDGHDRIIIYPCSSLLSIEESYSMRIRISESVGKVHSSLDQFSTPNTERRWNDRMKDIEGQLKTNTLWRAPHSKDTVGLPRLNLDVQAITLVEGRPVLLAQPRLLSEHLICDSDRLPGIATMMSLEQQWSKVEKSTEDGRKKLLKSWLSTAPQTYSHKNALSTLLGGPWIWRYHSVLLSLAQARVFDDKEERKQALDWLNDVSRLQARLGVLRTWKSGLWFGITGVVVSFFTWQLESLTASQSVIVGLVSLSTAIVSHLAYWAKDPKPY